MSVDRRTFLKGSAATAGLGFGVAGLGAQTAKFRTALIGAGWWGTNIMREAVASGRCQMVGLCDVDDNQLDKAQAELRKLCTDNPKRYRDYRELLEKEKPQIAIVATPDHWHPLITIAAVKSGADVYVEKPICHTIYEGRAMVKAAREAGRIVQVGTHRRVSPHNVSGMKFLKEGRAGKIGMVRAFVHYGGGPGEPEHDSEVPGGLDWDMYVGPAPIRPFNKRIHPRGFRSFLDFANGQLGDWGIHWMDQILWWTDEKWPRMVSSVGARHIRRDNTDAPDTQVVQFEFDSFTAVWEHRQYAGNNTDKGENVGVYFYGTNGIFHMGWQKGWTFYPADGGQVLHEDPKLNEPDQQNIKELWADLLNSIETRKLPACDIEIGHRSTTMSLLGMLSMKLGRSVRWDGDKQVILNDADANRLLRREYRKPWIYPET